LNAHYKAREDRHLLEEKLGYQFKDKNKLLEALTHPSFAHESKRPEVQSYERLEFLGDAVLELMISHYIWERFSTLSEGEMTRLRAEVVQKGTLARVGREIDLGPYIRLGRGERMRGGIDRDSNLADCLEAILGAVFLDGGISVARVVCRRIFYTELQGLNPSQLRNFKSQLQEVAASMRLTAPRYKLLGVSGPEHTPTFSMEVRIGDHFHATGKGVSKKEATQEAAHVLLTELRQIQADESRANLIYKNAKGPAGQKS